MVTLGNGTFDPKEVAKLSLKEFKELYRGKLNVDLKKAYYKIKKGVR